MTERESVSECVCERESTPRISLEGLKERKKARRNTEGEGGRERVRERERETERQTDRHRGMKREKEREAHFLALHPAAPGSLYPMTA